MDSPRCNGNVCLGDPLVARRVRVLGFPHGEKNRNTVSNLSILVFRLEIRDKYVFFGAT